MPVNQVILGGDPLLGSSLIGTNLDEQLQMLEKYKQNLEMVKQLKVQSQQPQQRLIWDDIDIELNSLTDEQKGKLFQDNEYIETYNKIQSIVNNELLNLVKIKIENSQEGKDLLSNQLRIVKKLKTKIVEETNKEMETFMKFKNFSKNNPGITYEEFIKANI